MTTRNFNVKNGLTVGTAVIDAATGNANVGNLETGRIVATGNISGTQLISNIATGTAPFIVTSTTQVANLNVAQAGTAGSATTAGTVTTNAQPNITSVGTLTGLTITGVTNLGAVGNVIITGGTSGFYLQTNGSGNLTWAAVPSGNGIANGTSNVSIPVADGNVNTSVGGNANVFVVTGTGANIAGTLNATGNANVLNLGTARVFANANITTPQVIANIAQGTAPFLVNSNTVVANLNADLLDGFNTATAATADTVAVRDANGNISANFFIGNGSQLTGLTTDRISNGTSNVSIPASGGNINLVAAGNTTMLVTGTGANITGTANVSGNLTTGGVVAATGNVSGGNLTTTGVITATGNITTSANLVSNNILGNGGAITITSGGTNTNINLKPNGTGNIDANATFITSVKNPINLQDAATKSYVDTLVSTGISIHPSVNAATTTTLATATGGTITYNNGASGVGANLVTTGSFNLIDTANVQTVGARILVKNEANAAHNGVYTWANASTIVRSTDTDTYGSADPDALGQNDYFFVLGGTTNINTSWICSTVGTITFGTTNIVFSQFSATQAYTAGTGLTLSPQLEFRITNTAVTTGSYGNGDRVATFTVNQQGQLTAAGDTPITANAANLTGTTLNSTIVNSSLTSVGTLTALTVTGTATAGNLSTGGTLGVTGNANVGNLGTATAIITTGNITTINSGLLQNGNSNVTIAANGNISLFVTGNTTARLLATATGVNVAGTLNATGNANVLNLDTAQVLATANITTPQVIANIAQGNAPFLVNSNTVVANLNADLLDGFNTATANTASTVAVRDTNGNLSANFFIGNGSQLTGINTSIIANGNSNVSIPAANGNVNISAVGNTTMIVTGTGANITGTLNATGNANVLNLGAATGIFTTAANTPLVQNGNSNITLTANSNVSTFIAGNTTAQFVVTSTGANIAGTANVVGNANVGNIGATAGVFTANVTAGNVYANTGTIGASLLTGTLTTAAQPNITSVGTLGNLVVTGNVTTGNIRLNGGLTSNRANVAIDGATVIDQFAPGTFRTAKYVISASGDNGYQSIETLLVHDGVDAYITIYGSISSNVSSEIVNLSANLNGVSGNISLYASNIGPNVKVNIVSSYIQI